MKYPPRPVEQFIFESYVSDMAESMAFYALFGFTVERSDGEFAVLKWESSYLFLERADEMPKAPEGGFGNIRMLVPDVDRYWEMARKAGVTVRRPLADRHYSLRDFTVVSPDGLGLRFASWKE